VYFQHELEHKSLKGQYSQAFKPMKELENKNEEKWLKMNTL